jgi:hypothetical protein
MVAGFFAAPAPHALGGGTWRLDASRETQTFGRAALVQTRSQVRMTLGRWLTDRTRVTSSAAVERWSDRPFDVALAYGVEHWRLGDRLRLSAAATQALGANRFTAAETSAALRSTAALDGFVLSGIAGYGAASGASPPSIWPGADTGQARSVLLRAHPLLEDGVVTGGGAFGRRLAFGTIEAQRWRVLHQVPLRLAPAAFVDLARASHGLEPAPMLHVDAGAGLRVALPASGVLRLDVARGFRDGGTVVSAGWDLRWR